MIECIECEGQGKFYLNGNDDKEIKCEVCKGKGRV